MCGQHLGGFAMRPTMGSIVAGMWQDLGAIAQIPFEHRRMNIYVIPWIKSTKLPKPSI